MRYEIKGDNFPIIQCYLEEGEAMKNQGGSMVWMSSNMVMSTNAGGGFSRWATGEKIFQNIYTAQNGPGEITFGSTLPGSICPIRISNSSMIFQKKAFLASTIDVNISLKINGLKNGIFGREGFAMQRFSGSGIVFIEIDGAFINYNLGPGEKVIVSTGSVAGFDESVKMDIQAVKGISNVLFGSEGLFFTTLTGPGRVFLQTMPMSTIAGAIAPYFSRK